MIVLRLRVEVDATRQRPLLDGYRASMWLGETAEVEDPRGRVVSAPRVHDGVLVFEDTDRAAPGTIHTARAWVVFSEHFPRSVAPGTVLAFLEGHREADRATVLEVLLAVEPFPGNDYARAKRQPLGPAPSDDSDEAPNPR